MGRLYLLYPLPNPGDCMKNVKDYGAVGDGVADDTAAIQTALNQAGKNDSVWMPGGKYLVSEPILIQSRRLFGEHHWRGNQGGSTLVASEAFAGSEVVSCRNNAASLVDLMIDANGVDYGFHSYSMHGTTARVENVSVWGASVAGFYFEHSMIQHVSRCLATKNAIGFLIEASNGATYSGCSATHNTETGIRVVRGNSSGSCTIRECQSESNGGHGIELVGIAASNGKYLNQVRVRDCWIEDNEWDGIHLEFAGSCEITGNRLIPGSSSPCCKCIRLVRSRICTVRDNRAAAGSNQEWIVILDEHPVHPNIYENNWRLSDIVAHQLVVEELT